MRRKRQPHANDGFSSVRTAEPLEVAAAKEGGRYTSAQLVVYGSNPPDEDHADDVEVGGMATAMVLRRPSNQRVQEEDDDEGEEL